MLPVGTSVVYHAHEGHHTETVKGEGDDKVTTLGSIHHHQHREFAGLVTRHNPDGSYGLVIFPPNRPHVHIDDAGEGDGPHRCRLPTQPEAPAAA